MAFHGQVLLCLWFATCATAFSLHRLEGGTKRSDDPNPLQSVVSALTQRLEQLEAKNAALENEMQGMKATMSQLDTKISGKKCLSGKLNFDPHFSTTIIEPGSALQHRQTLHVTFSPAFASVPSVTAGVVHLDTDHTANTRLDVSISNVQTTGFDMTAMEWDSDTGVFHVSLNWMACST